MSGTRTQLIELVYEAREQCLLEHTPRYEYLKNIDLEEQAEFISGMCVENAETLKLHLNKHPDFSAEIIKGGLDIAKEPTPQSYEEAKQIGTLHHWVLVETPNGTFHVDVLTEKPTGCNPNPLVTKHPPENYIIF